MTHEGLEEIQIKLKDMKGTAIITSIDDHQLKDYVPFILIEKWSNFTPEDFKILLAEKGMIPIGASCHDCQCKIDELTYSEGNKEGNKIVHGLYVTPINKAYEKSQMTEWVRKLTTMFNEAAKG